MRKTLHWSIVYIQSLARRYFGQDNQRAGVGGHNPSLALTRAELVDGRDLLQHTSKFIHAALRSAWDLCAIHMQEYLAIG